MVYRRKCHLRRTKLKVPKELLFQEGTIGRDLVVKPVPASMRHLVAKPDDEVFLDARNEDIQNDVTMDTGRKIRSKRDSKDVYHHHIIFKRSQPTEEDDFSDYGMPV